MLLVRVSIMKCVILCHFLSPKACEPVKEKVNLNFTELSEKLPHI